ncbi:hypothetical protein [Fimbriimonas ginsengisoli]|uniref:Uncharacterized protein n=1 Tax=Fimbriimonas ginsengisoli Gsoil 348 TaxID=661478 RepID=A0A068NPR6_FIMGI|nr:hypothetical protein [Fimbriimonas ginsengisoli]AIE84755.1 hypothetical protein OP10G_1387 [Fimbriimonas ginsengisoli Gsoil 348]
MLGALLAAVLLQANWRVDFTGKPAFGCCTRVFALEDRLIFLDSPPPTVSDGGDIYVWRDKAPAAQKVFSVQDQGIRMIRKFGKSIIVPGIDAMENWDWGNWYLSQDQGQTWTKYRNLPKAVHVFDFAQWRGRLYAGVSDTSGAVLSSTDGSIWKKEFGAAGKDSFGEVLSVVPLPDALYAFWVEQWGAGAPEANKAVDCYRFDGATWKPLKLLPGINAVWNTRVVGSSAFILLPGRSYLLHDGKAEPVLPVDGLVPVDVIERDKELLWLAAGSHNDWAIFRTPYGEKVGERTKLVDLPPGLSGNSLTVHGDRLYVACNGAPSGQLISIPLVELKR